MNRLDENEIAYAREQRLKEIQMWSMLQEFATYLIFLIFVFLVTFSNQEQNSFLQVKHLRKYILNTREINEDYTKVCHLLRVFFFIQMIIYRL